MNDPKKNYLDSIHLLGRITVVILIAAMISVPILISVVFKVQVDTGTTFKAFINAFMVFGIIGIIEFFSYAPILGPGGMYLAFISGNISNLKLPSAISGIKLSNYKNGTKEAEMVSIISISVSTIVTTVILFVGMYFLSFLTPILNNPVLKPGFSNLLPAIFGALSFPIIIKTPKIALAPGVLAAALTVIKGTAFIGQNQALLMPLFIAVTIAGSYVVYKTQPKGESKI